MHASKEGAMTQSGSFPEQSGSLAAPLRLLALGDCNTGGANGTAAEDQVPFRLAERLSSAERKCTVQNLGRTMSTSREGLARMRRDAGEADLLLLNFGLVDAWVTSIPRVYLSYYPDHRLKRLARKLLKWVKRKLRSPWLRRIAPTGEVVPIDEYESNLRAILDLARRRNPEVQIVMWGTVGVRDDPLRTDNIERYNERLRQIASSEENACYLDSRAVMAALDADAAYLDHLHISAAAADRIAAEMAKLDLTQALCSATIRGRRNAA